MELDHERAATSGERDIVVKAALFARALTRQPTGRGYVARELVTALATLPEAPQIELFGGEAVDLPNCRYHPARGGNPLSDVWRVFRGVARDVERLEVDVLWAATHFLPRGLSRDLPKVITLLDLVWKDHPETVSIGNRLAAGWMEQGILEADRVVCISEFTRSRLLAYWPGLEGRSEVVPLAPNPRLRAPEAGSRAAAERIGDPGPYILNVDTFEPRKDLLTAVEAVGKIGGLRFVHCGHPGWRSDSDLASARSRPWVRMLGYVGEADLGALYAGAVACIFPSVYEGFHLPPLDAMSIGVPVLVSDIPVHREVLGDAARYFPVKDVTALEGQIRELLSSEALRQDLIHRGRERAAAFRWDRSASRLLKILGEVAGVPPV